ncbi:hypothetical protein [Streptacidiphilus sp. MAP12-16]|uniref:hypothetical protein n=1 Tax=Streptacidiphilus sp. MAP12-16 TaxID=3156300 RepID=UPI003519D071
MGLLVSVAALVAVGQVAGWVGDPQAGARASAAADSRAADLQATLRRLPSGGGPADGGVDEAAFDRIVRDEDGTVVSVAYGPGGTDLLSWHGVELTVRLLGSTTGGALNGRHLTVLHRCYRYSWSGSPARAEVRSVDCPTDPSTVSDSDWAAAVGLVTRLAELPVAEQDVPATSTGVARLLAEVGLPPGTGWDAAAEQGDTLLALSRATSCVFVDVHAGRLTSWPAPQLAACTAARAYQAVVASRA